MALDRSPTEIEHEAGDDAGARRVADSRQRAGHVGGRGEFEVILTGTGYPRPDPKRAGPGCLVVADGLRLQFDCGRGTVGRLVALGILPAQLDALFFTHYHSDHVTDLADVAMTGWLLGRDEAPPRFVGPTGLGQRLRAVEALLAADATRRAAHAGRADDFTLSSHEFERPSPDVPQPIYERGGVRVLAAAVEHGHVEEAVGFRIEHAGRAVAISGDCSGSSGVVELARGADLLVHEIVSPTLLRSRIGTGTGVDAVVAYHSTPEQVGRVATEAGVPRVLLTHIIPSPRSREDEAHFVDAVARHYGGEVILGDDLMRVAVP